MTQPNRKRREGVCGYHERNSGQTFHPSTYTLDSLESEDS